MMSNIRTEFLERLAQAVKRWPDDVNPQELQALSRAISRMPEAERFELLVVPFTDAQFGGFLGQQYAGSLLFSLKPPCPFPIDEVLRKVLPGWNRSVEELPSYLVATFGRDVVLNALDQVDDSDAVPPDVVETVRFWVCAVQQP